MIATATHSPEAVLRARFGPESLISRFGAIWVVHVDHPTEAEIQERLAEIERDILEPEDCALCDLLQLQAGDVLIYDGAMCFHEPAPWRQQDLNERGQRLQDLPLRRTDPQRCRYDGLKTPGHTATISWKGPNRGLRSVWERARPVPTMPWGT